MKKEGSSKGGKLQFRQPKNGHQGDLGNFLLAIGEDGGGFFLRLDKMDVISSNNGHSCGFHTSFQEIPLDELIAQMYFIHRHNCQNTLKPKCQFPKREEKIEEATRRVHL
jgi:hypothetical protein